MSAGTSLTRANPLHPARTRLTPAHNCTESLRSSHAPLSGTTTPYVVQKSPRRLPDLRIRTPTGAKQRNQDLLRLGSPPAIAQE